MWHTQNNTSLYPCSSDSIGNEEILFIEGIAYTKDTYSTLPERYTDVKKFLHEWFSDSPYMRLRTSGSTGAPKEFIAEKNKMRNSARLTCTFLGLQQGNTALVCMPLSFIAGKMMLVRGLVAGLNLHIIPPCGEPLAEQEDTHFDFSAMVPLQIYNSLQSKQQKQRLEQISILLIGGGAISSSMEKELSVCPNAIYATYGMTETLSHIALRRVTQEKHDSHFHSSIDLQNVQKMHSFAKEDEHSDSKDHKKEKRQRYTPLPSVYLSLSEEGALIIDAPLVCSEPLRTRDLATIYSDGSFEIKGRLDNVINTGGMKVQIEEVESKLTSFFTCPFAITSVLHDKFGEAVTLLLERDLLHNEKKEEKVRHKIKNALFPEMTPKYIFFVDALPLTESGKINRVACRQMASLLADKKKL